MAAVIYVRALVFTMILSAACVLVLWVSSLSAFKPYGYFWLTIAVGILIVVVRTILGVYFYQADVRRQMRNAVQNSFTNACPDFWTLDASKNVCRNEFSSEDQRYRYVVGNPLATTLPPLREDATDAACATAGTDYPFEHLSNLCAQHKTRF